LDLTSLNLAPSFLVYNQLCSPSYETQSYRVLDAGEHSGLIACVDRVLWYVAHTRPRCEKKLVEYCERENLAATLPCYSSAHKYRGKTVVFRKPLFPGYVFLQLTPDQRGKVYNSDHVANLLDVFDQDLFVSQLSGILAALETELEIFLAPNIGKGMRVSIKQGPLRGMEGWVEERYGPNTVLLRLDFIGQAAAVKVEATDLEPT
jgi:transcription antitermination factor NusG